MDVIHTLITADLLRQNLTKVRVLDCRTRLGDPAYGKAVYSEGHIPGAIHVDLDLHMAAPPGPQGRHPLPARTEWLGSCRAWGLNDEDTIIAYDDAGGAFAARAWWMLRWLGHARTGVLDGGLASWSDGLDTETPRPSRGNFSDRPPLTRIITAQGIEARSDTTLIDARAAARFEGREEPIDHTAGHIPGAICVPFNGNLGPDGCFLSAATLRERFASFPEDTVCYCGSGVTAAHNILAMCIAGLPEPALYPGSWSEWIESPDRPVATGP